jgi:hypothetical protein
MRVCRHMPACLRATHINSIAYAEVTEMSSELWMHACMHVFIHIHIYVCMHVCTYECLAGARAQTAGGRDRAAELSSCIRVLIRVGDFLFKIYNHLHMHAAYIHILTYIPTNLQTHIDITFRYRHTHTHMYVRK